MFSISNNIAILLEIMNFQPFSDPARWWIYIVNRLNEELKRSYSVRSVKERVDLIAGQFVTNEHKNLQK